MFHVFSAQTAALASSYDAYMRRFNFAGFGPLEGDTNMTRYVLDVAEDSLDQYNRWVGQGEGAVVGQGEGGKKERRKD